MTFSWRTRITLLLPLLASGLLLLLVAWTFVPGSGASWFYFGGRLLELSSPLSGTRVAVGTVPIQVRFPNGKRVLADTFRCLLNGSDITDRLQIAENGADGSLFPLREGRNTLRVEVFGKALWGKNRLVEDALEIEFDTRPLPLFDRASAPAGGERPA